VRVLVGLLKSGVGRWGDHFFENDRVGTLDGLTFPAKNFAKRSRLFIQFHRMHIIHMSRMKFDKKRRYLQ